MLRHGLDLPEVKPEEHPLFSAKARDMLRAIEVSDVWQGLRDGINAQREALLASPLKEGENLYERWGAIQQLSLLLHGGPQMILQYSQLAASTQPDGEAEREYNPQVHSFEGR